MTTGDDTFANPSAADLSVELQDLEPVGGTNIESRGIARASTTQPSRIDEAIAPAGFIASAVVYSMFIADHGLYMIRTGPGWRMNYRSLPRNELMAADARRVAAELDPANLATESAARHGSVFIPGTDLCDVELGSRLDGLPDLRFESGTKKYRVQFDDHRHAEVEAFFAVLSATFIPDSPSETGEVIHVDKRTTLPFEGTAIEVVSLPSPCWGVTPYVAVADERLFVEYLAPTGLRHGEMSIVYRSDDDEQARFAAGELDMLELCQRLGRAVWGSTPPATGDSPW